MLLVSPGTLGTGTPDGEPGQTWPETECPSLCCRLALQALCLAQRQYSLLQAANLLTPDIITEFEMLQRLVQEQKSEPGTPNLAREAPPAQELSSESSEFHFPASYQCCLQGPAGGPGASGLVYVAAGGWAPGIVDFYPGDPSN